jgi:3-hydroxyisobutyrate dehydrogenase-like beta-hydroxyacid dehydrogenase
MDTVGLIGLGNMGSGMAGNIQQAGYALMVYDTRPEAVGSRREAFTSTSQPAVRL